MLFPQNKDTTLHSHPEWHFEHHVWVCLSVSLKAAVIVCTSLNNNKIPLLYSPNLVMTLTFVTVLHRYLNFEADYYPLCVVIPRKTASWIYANNETLFFVQ